MNGKSPCSARTLATIQQQHPVGLGIFVYFNNEIKVYAPFDAISLTTRLGMKPPAPWPEGETSSASCEKAVAEKL